MSDKKDTDAQTFPEVICIAAVGADGAIGKNGDMPWHLSEDLRHFKETTMGAPVVMGRVTWESLPFKPLPGRHNMVISRNPDYTAEGASVVASIEDALKMAGDAEAVFIIGGASIYTRALPFASKLILTEIEVETPDADTFFPAFNRDEWRVSESRGPFTSKSGLSYSFVTYERDDNK